MKHGSLFSGIGGFDLAAEWMGWENVFHCEWNDFGKRAFLLLA
jgi:DNA (cytosine-5)-methyltransferase 1